MNAYMNRVSMAVFSYFDTGSESSEASEPERFYDRIEEMILSSKFCHGFALGQIYNHLQPREQIWTLRCYTA